MKEPFLTPARTPDSWVLWKRSGVLGVVRRAGHREPGCLGSPAAVQQERGGLEDKGGWEPGCLGSPPPLSTHPPPSHAGLWAGRPGPLGSLQTSIRRDGHRGLSQDRDRGARAGPCPCHDWGRAQPGSGPVCSELSPAVYLLSQMRSKPGQTQRLQASAWSRPTGARAHTFPSTARASRPGWGGTGWPDASGLFSSERGFGAGGESGWVGGAGIPDGRAVGSGG